MGQRAIRPPRIDTRLGPECRDVTRRVQPEGTPRGPGHAGEALSPSAEPACVPGNSLACVVYCVYDAISTPHPEYTAAHSLEFPMHRTQGFTLIELMIVVAIIGLLAAIAIPAYQDYTVRAKITEATQMLARTKTGVSEYYKAQGRMPTNMAEAGFDTNIDSQYVRSVRYNGGILTAELKALGGTANAGEVFGLSAITSPTVVEWVCGTSFVTGTGVEAKYLPANCRGN